MGDQESGTERGRAVRARLRARQAGGRGDDQRRPWAGESAAIYCRISHIKDDDQTGVDRQREIAREVAARLGLVVSPEHVFVDPNRSAWQRNRKRPGWDRLLDVVRGRKVRHVIAYHPDRLMRQPKDLEELLSIADDQNITLHGQANRRDLSDPDDRFFLRIEVAHACRSSDDTSRRLKDKMLEDASEGKPHSGGKRVYGYDKTGWHVVPEEARIVRVIFRLFLAGMSPYQIADVLCRHGRTRNGTPWIARTVRDVLKNPTLAALRSFHGETIPGLWPPIIDRGVWDEAQERLSYRSTQHTSSGRHFYLLRGLIMCDRCELRMAGTNKGAYYVCTRASYSSADPRRCVRRINAKIVEDFVSDAAVGKLEKLDVTGEAATEAGVPVALQEKIDGLREELEELREGWKKGEFSAREYREDRKVINDRIQELQQQTATPRPALEILAGLTGPNARAAWDRMAENGEKERMNAVLRFLFGAVIIGESTTPVGKFDYSRIRFEENPL
ncbi:recombinase family protein [Parafrankia elaeagni]|uniref:recombinase family protein n=1 Tax=Parafrankia elaeagni TaxID=222534 RepID=UPI00039B25AE|nr:recombinase family protein [Parafrankia elaeagni]